MKSLNIAYYSDILCVWAYINQVKVDELKMQFTEKIDFSYHYTDTFHSVENKLESSWSHRGGNQAYAKHILDLKEKFPHIKLHKDIWTKNIPTSSANAHVFLKAVAASFEAKTLEIVLKEMRKSFFELNIDITTTQNQLKVLQTLNLPETGVLELIHSGKALELLILDHKMAKDTFIPGSPSFNFNNGRQIIYGNVGYKIIELNIKELLENPTYPQSWC
jgi:predicted DsbA family dithiol-disulfide isomerase